MGLLRLSGPHIKSPRLNNIYRCIELTHNLMNQKNLRWCLKDVHNFQDFCFLQLKKCSFLLVSPRFCACWKSSTRAAKERASWAEYSLMESKELKGNTKSKWRLATKFGFGKELRERKEDWKRGNWNIYRCGSAMFGMSWVREEEEYETSIPCGAREKNDAGSALSSPFATANVATFARCCSAIWRIKSEMCWEKVGEATTMMSSGAYQRPFKYSLLIGAVYSEGIRSWLRAVFETKECSRM